MCCAIVPRLPPNLPIQFPRLSNNSMGFTARLSWMMYGLGSLMPMTITWAETGTPAVPTAHPMKASGKEQRHSASGVRTYLKTGRVDGIGLKTDYIYDGRL